MDIKHTIGIFITIISMVYGLYDFFLAPDDYSGGDDFDVCDAFKDHEIRLNNRDLDTIPMTLSVIECIHKINLSHNKFTYLPDLASYPSLNQVDLSHNQFTKFPSSKGLSRIKTLNLSHNQIETVAASELLKFGYLENLYLKDNPDLASLPPEITRLKRLKKLDIRKTKLSQDHPAVRKLMKSIPKVEVYWYSKGDELYKN